MKRFFLIFSLLFVLLPLCSQRMYLLSVGISDYEGEEGDLRLPANDATSIARVYEKNNNARTVVLLNSSATCEAVKDSLQRLVSRAERDDIVALFFSGHGAPDGLVAYDGILSHEELRGIFSKSKSVNKMVFADACFSGKMRATAKRSSTAKKQNVMFFLSSRSEEKSIEMHNMENGLFTAFLERGLRGGADDNRDRTITARELFGFVSKGVKEKSNERQHPVMWGRFGDDMPVIKW